MTVDYINAHEEEYGVEPICEVLQVAPSSATTPRRSRSPSARSLLGRGDDWR